MTRRFTSVLLFLAFVSSGCQSPKAVYSMQFKPRKDLFELKGAPELPLSEVSAMVDKRQGEVSTYRSAWIISSFIPFWPYKSFQYPKIDLGIVTKQFSYSVQEQLESSKLFRFDTKKTKAIIDKERRTITIGASAESQGINQWDLYYGNKLKTKPNKYKKYSNNLEPIFKISGILHKCSKQGYLTYYGLGFPLAAFPLFYRANDNETWYDLNFEFMCHDIFGELIASVRFKGQTETWTDNDFRQLSIIDGKRDVIGKILENVASEFCKKIFNKLNAKKEAYWKRVTKEPLERAKEKKRKASKRDK
jgi:hypothetical protein